MCEIFISANPESYESRTRSVRLHGVVTSIRLENLHWEVLEEIGAGAVPRLVVFNKIDRADAKPERVRQELLQHELVVEELGGEVLDVEVSALKKTNLDRLEEAILLQSELLDLKANPNRPAEGVVLEAKVERGRGPVATVLIQRGTLHIGDIFVSGSEWGRVRALIDERGESQREAGPSTPIEVLGLNGIPLAGDDFVVIESESRAREVTDFRQRRRRDTAAAAGARGTLEQMFSQIAAGVAKELPIVVKSDVQGSLEAIVGSLARISTSEVSVRVLHSAVGGINESDVILAKASDAVIIGFNVRANPQARDMARRDGVDITADAYPYTAGSTTVSVLFPARTDLFGAYGIGLADVRRFGEQPAQALLLRGWEISIHGGRQQL